MRYWWAVYWITRVQKILRGCLKRGVLDTITPWYEKTTVRKTIMIWVYLIIWEYVGRQDGHSLRMPRCLVSRRCYAMCRRLATIFHLRWYSAMVLCITKCSFKMVISNGTACSQCVCSVHNVIIDDRFLWLLAEPDSTIASSQCIAIVIAGLYVSSCSVNFADHKELTYEKCFKGRYCSSALFSHVSFCIDWISISYSLLYRTCLANGTLTFMTLNFPNVHEARIIM